MTVASDYASVMEKGEDGSECSGRLYLTTRALCFSGHHPPGRGSRIALDVRVPVASDPLPSVLLIGPATGAHPSGRSAVHGEKEDDWRCSKPA